jgi:hypothetical protein
MPRSSRTCTFVVPAVVLIVGSAVAQQKTVTGSFGPSSPTWNRVFTLSSADADVTGCSYPAYDSEDDGQPYAVFPIAVTEPERLLATVVEEGTTLDDTALLLYCDPFAPADPEHNLIVHNHGFGADAAFEDFSEIDLVPGTIYELVLTTAVAGDFGTYEVELLSATAHFVPELAQASSAGVAAAALGLLAHRRRGRVHGASGDRAGDREPITRDDPHSASAPT